MQLSRSISIKTTTLRKQLLTHCFDCYMFALVMVQLHMCATLEKKKHSNWEREKRPWKILARTTHADCDSDLLCVFDKYDTCVWRLFPKSRQQKVAVNLSFWVHIWMIVAELVMRYHWFDSTVFLWAHTNSFFCSFIILLRRFISIYVLFHHWQLWLSRIVQSRSTQLLCFSLFSFIVPPQTQYGWLSFSMKEFGGYI